MRVDRARIARLISSAKKVDAVTLNPSDSNQTRQSAIRKVADQTVKWSDQRSVLVVAIEV